MSVQSLNNLDYSIDWHSELSDLRKQRHLLQEVAAEKWSANLPISYENAYRFLHYMVNVEEVFFSYKICLCVGFKNE